MTDQTSPPLKPIPITAIILATINDHPGGLTTDQVAAKIGHAPKKVGGPLSKLAAYGRIKQIPRKRETSNGLCGSIWMPLEAI